jgi:hypothetical protein
VAQPDAFRRNFPELADELFAKGESPPAILVWVDAWTSLGGSQFIDSPGTGRYHTHIVDELVPFVDGRYRTLPEAAHRGIAGKSSGGYGAMVNPMLRPDVFGGMATHAGDALFEMCYLPDFRRSVRTLRDKYEGSFDKFWDDFRSRPAFANDSDATLLNDWCMAACYSADEDGTVQLPYDTDTGELRPDVWERWLAWDPVRMARSEATPCGRCARSTSTAASATSSSSTSARRRSGGSSRPRASPTTSSSSSTRRTRRSSTATRSA